MKFTLMAKEGFRAIGRTRHVGGSMQDAFKEIASFHAEADEDGLIAQIAPLGTGEPVGILDIYDYDRWDDGTRVDMWIAIASQASPPEIVDVIDIPPAYYLVFSDQSMRPESMFGLKERALEFFRSSSFVHANSPAIEIWPLIQRPGDSDTHEFWIPIVLSGQDNRPKN